jgi:hypothetical protein
MEYRVRDRSHSGPQSSQWPQPSPLAQDGGTQSFAALLDANTAPTRRLNQCRRHKPLAPRGQAHLPAPSQSPTPIQTAVPTARTPRQQAPARACIRPPRVQAIVPRSAPAALPAAAAIVTRPRQPEAMPPRPQHNAAPPPRRSRAGVCRTIAARSGRMRCGGIRAPATRLRIGRPAALRPFRLVR